MGRDKDSVYVATDSGSIELKGQTYSFTKGVTRVAGDHPLAKIATLFEPADENLSYSVEQATAAPAEKRSAPRAARKAKKAEPPEPEPKKPEGLTMKSLGSK